MAGEQPTQPPPWTMFPRRRERRSVAQWIRGAFVDNLPIKFIAFVLSLTVFILVHSDKDQEVGAYVKLAYTMPEERVLVSEHVDQVRVTVKGSWRRLKRFNEDALDPILIDLRLLKTGELTMRPDMFRMPPGLKIQSINPQSIPLEFQPLMRKQVIVEPELSKEPARGYGVAETRVRRVGCAEGTGEDCSKVTIQGAQGEVESTESVTTEEISLTGRSASFEARVATRAALPHVEVVGQPDVVVAVNLVEQLTARDVGSLPIELSSASGSVRVEPEQIKVEPKQVQVTLRGARLAVEGVAPATLTAVVSVFADDLPAGRVRKAPVVVDGVPRGIAVEVNPREVTIRSARAAP